MIERRSIVSLLVAAVAVTGIVRADLTPVGPTEAVLNGPVQAYDERCASCDGWEAFELLSLHASSLVPHASSRLFDLSVPLGELDLLPIDTLSEQGLEEGQVCQAPPVSILSDQQNSLVLCLYGLLGFGAFRSLSCVRRLSFSVIPDWYHSGGPAQIGHSLAIAPDCQASTTVCCLVQPAAWPRDPLPIFHEGMVESLWRRAQFVPTTLAARGPPNCAIECWFPLAMTL